MFGTLSPTAPMGPLIKPEKSTFSGPRVSRSIYPHISTRGLPLPYVCCAMGLAPVYPLHIFLFTLLPLWINSDALSDNRNVIHPFHHNLRTPTCSSDCDCFPPRVAFKMTSTRKRRWHHEDSTVYRVGIRIGTDFSGIDAPLIACRQLGMSNIEHVFSCENNKSCQNIIAHCHAPQHLLPDIRTRVVATTPPVDCLVSGFPCQPFSGLGGREGVADTRGLLVSFTLDYVDHHRPRVVICENVAAIATTHAALAEYVIQYLEERGYTVFTSIL